MASSFSSNISDFRSNFFGGTRPNRFRVEAAIAGSSLQNPFLIKAATLPPSTLGIITVPYRGRVLKIPGDRLFAEWTVSILDDGEGGEDIRGKIVSWSNSINAHVENVTKDPTGLTEQWKVHMLTQEDNTEIRSITLHNCWPVEVGAIELTYDTADTLTEFPITLAYDFWTEEGNTDSGGGAGGGGFEAPPPYEGPMS